jgi:prepilin-type N-terminal cleavage/methylation domain-containing protein
MNHRSHRRCGFTLIEVLIVVILLGILAAMVIPKYYGASSDSREASLRTQLMRVRTQLEYFRANQGDAPLMVDNQWAELGDNDYLTTEPANPLNGSQGPKGRTERSS